MTVRKSIFTVIALIFTSIMITGNLIPLFDQSPNALIGKTTVGPHMQSITLDLANGIRSDNDTNNDDWPMFCRDMSHTSRSDAQIAQDIAFTGPGADLLVDAEGFPEKWNRLLQLPLGLQRGPHASKNDALFGSGA